jgi:cobalt-zinc-cadmium efflux system outer membrane protein
MSRFRNELLIELALATAFLVQGVVAEEPTAVSKSLQYFRNEGNVVLGQQAASAPAPRSANKSVATKKTAESDKRRAVALPVPGEESHTRSTRPVAYLQANEGDADKSLQGKGVAEPLPLPTDGEDSSDDVVEPGNARHHGELTRDGDVDSAAGKLELERFQGMALEENPGLREASARMEAIRGKWIQAGLPPNPFIGYTGQQLASRGLSEQNGLMIGQLFITGKKLSLDQAAVSQEWHRASFDYESQRYRILTDTAIAYYEALAAQKKVATAEELVTIGNEATRMAQALYAAKERSKIDVLNAKIETDSIRMVLESANQRRQSAWRVLGAVTGVRDLPVQNLEGSLKDVPNDITWEAALGRLRTNSPELFAATAEVERARWIYQRARKQNIPNIDVQAIPFQRDNGIKGWDGALQVGANIPVWNKNQGAIREAWMRIAVAEQAVDRIELGLQARLSLVFERYLAAQKQIARYEEDVLPAAQEQLELVTKVYRRGESDSLAVLVSRRTLAQTSLSYIDALRDRAAAASEIEGLLLKESLLNAPGQ